MVLSDELVIGARFSETDAMGVVWHGNYLKYFEDGREKFGKKYGLEYLDMYENGYFTPIVKSEIEHKSPIYYGEEVKIKTTLIPTRAAKIVFEYEIVNLNTNQISATGKTVQVFLERESRLLDLNIPQFYLDWEKKNGIEKD